MTATAEVTRDASGVLSRREAWALAAMLAVSLFLRTLGLTWGLPTTERYYPYHPDEAVLAGVTAGVNPLWGDWTPGFYNYGSFSILLTRVVFDVTTPLVGGGTVPQAVPFAEWVGDFSRLMLTGRVLTALMGVGTVLVVWALGRRLGGRELGWLSGWFLAVCPVHVLHSHYLTVDVASGLLAWGALLAGARLGGGAWWVVGAGVLAGLAGGAKYNAGVVGIGLVAAIGMHREIPAGRRLALVGLLCLSAGLGFLVSTPGALLEPDRFWTDLTYELNRNREGQGLVFQGTPPALLYHLQSTLPLSLGWPGLALVLIGLGLIRYRGGSWTAAVVFAVAYGLLLVTSERKFTRYLVPLAPIFALLVAGALAWLRGRVGESGFRLAFCVTFLWAGASSLGIGVQMQAEDPRDAALRVLRTRSRTRDLVALATDPWFYTPPVHPTAGCVKASQAFGGPPIWAARGVSPNAYRGAMFTVLAPGSFPPAGALRPADLAANRPGWLLLSDYESEDHLRLVRVRPGFRSDMTDLLQVLERDYTVVARWDAPIWLRWSWWPSPLAPHDWRYFMPGWKLYVPSRAP